MSMPKSWERLGPAALAVDGGEKRVALHGNAADDRSDQGMAVRIGYVRETIFGGMWDFTANLAFKDTAYTPVRSGRNRRHYSIDSPDIRCFTA